MPYAEFADPQTLNLYAYVRNIPTSLVDGDGHGFVNEAFQNWGFELGDIKWGVGTPDPHKELQDLYVKTAAAMATEQGGTDSRMDKFIDWVNRTNRTLDGALGRWYQALANVLNLMQPCHDPRISCGVVFPTEGMGFGALAETGTIDSALVRFSQASVRPGFDAGGTISDLAEGLRTGKIDPSSIPPIRLVPRDGKLYTLDNRRLAAFQQAGMPVRYRLATFDEEIRESWKFTTKNDGVSIRIRGQQ